VDPIRLVLVDTMAFSYLGALGQLHLVPEMGQRTGKVAVTAAVLRQLHRAGIGATVTTWVRDRKLTEVSPKHDDEFARATVKTLASKDGGLVRRNRVDVELVEVARLSRGAVLSCERGIAKLAWKKGIPCLDLLDFFYWAIHVGAIELAQVDQATQRWRGEAASGTGAPADVAGDFSASVAARTALPELLQALEEMPGVRPTNL